VPAGDETVFLPLFLQMPTTTEKDCGSGQFFEHVQSVGVFGVRFSVCYSGIILGDIWVLCGSEVCVELNGACLNGHWREVHRRHHLADPENVPANPAEIEGEQSVPIHLFYE
jgi:hypothetical protein